ncbi:hypothetical protein BASA60_010778 [Batrachochytrium salamandrivorans]|nr:hypothetical protein BASA60_010778 [Batrachochytrium salamandrivorans]KAH6569578.1 hypothetical protein BASA62_004744 [Batrachochytrium salamandrivorans]
MAATEQVQGSDLDRIYMKQAISLANQSVATDSAYCVGAVLVVPTPLSQSLHPTVFTGFSRELPGNTHAEQVCLVKAEQAAVSSQALCDAAMYTTMEPCSLRLSGNVSCATRLVKAGIRRVVIGILEPPNLVAQCSGVQMLLDAGIQVVHLIGFRDECLAPNNHIVTTAC